jgi:hypothetical protein
MGSVDFIEIGRIAYELQERMGSVIARKYTATLAAEALANGTLEDHELWRAVEMYLTPRSEHIPSAI